jgi:hypothetical protein
MSDSDAYDRDDRAATRDDQYDDDGEIRTNPRESGKWISALVALIGAWLLVQAFLLEPVAGNFWSDVIVGVALIALGGYNYYRRSDERHGSVAVGAFIALLGLWMIATPFVLGSTEGTAAVESDIEFWNDIVVGLATFLLGTYSAYASRDRDVERTTART